MAPITDNIEILKTKVDQIKKDLDALKAETNEAQKKTQAEAAAEKMKTAKEEINKKLEGLKGLTDENSKADVVKLEAMLKTVEGSDSELEKLKINVVEPSEAPKAKEAVDTTLDFTAITEGISAMKTMVTECQSLIDSYKSAKSTLSETEKTVKEKEIEEKKIAIEKKRKDIQAIIDKIKKARSEVKIDDITDETIKKALKEQKETEEKNISDLQKQLNALSTPATTFFEKVKNGANKAREWAKENPWKTGGIVVGAGLLIGWMAGLFRKKKGEKKEEGEKKEKKSIWKKILLWGGGILGGVLIRKNRESISDRFKNLFGGKKDEKEKHTGSGNDSTDLIYDNKDTLENFERNEKKDEYNEIGTTINSYIENIGGKAYDEKGLLGKGEIDGGYPGVTVWTLDNSYDKVNDILSEKGLYEQEQITDTVQFRKWLKSIRAKPLYKSMIGVLSIGSKIPLVGGTFEKLKNAKQEDLDKLDFTEQDMKNCKEIFAKNIMIFDFLMDKKRNLKEKLIEQKLALVNFGDIDKAKFDLMSEEKKQELIGKIEKDDAYMKDINGMVNEKFNNLKIREVSGNLKKVQYEKSINAENIMNADVSVKAENVLKEVREEKKKVLGDIDLGSLQEKLKNETFDREGDRDALLGISDRFLDSYIEGEGLDYTKRAYFMSYFGHIPELWGSKDFEKERFFKDMGFDTKYEVIKNKIKKFQEKTKNKTITKDDIAQFENEIDTYFADRAGWENSIMNIQEVKKENGNMRVRFKRFNKGTRTDTIDVCFKGDFSRSTPASLVVSSIMLRPAGKVANQLGTALLAMPKVRYKLAGAVIKAPGRLIDKSIGKFYDNLVGKRIPIIKYAYYYGANGMENIAYDFRKGRLTVEEAMKLSRSGSKLQMMTKLYGGDILGDGKVEFLEENKILENTELRKRLFTRSKRLERKTVGNVFTSNFEEIKGIFGNIDKVNDVDLKILLKKAFINTSDFEKSKMFIEKGIALQNGLPKGGKLNIFQYVGAGKDKLMSAEKFGAFVGKNMGRTYKIEKLHTFMEFVDKAKKANKINNIDVFMNNSLSHRSVIEKSGYDINTIEKLGLNLGRYERLSIKIKSGIKNMIQDLNGFLKNPKMKPFQKGIETKIDDLTEYEKTVTPESIKALEEADRLDKVTGFGKLTKEGRDALKSLNIILKGEKGAEILKALQGAKKLEDVKDVLAKAGIDASKIDDGVLMKIAQTKDMKKIENIVNYGAEFESVNVLKKIISNPVMKSFGRWLGVVGVATDFIFTSIEFSSILNQSQEIKKYNLQRGENKESEAYFDVVVGGLAATAGGCAFIPGVGRVASAVLLGTAGVMTGVKEMGNLYYGEIDKFRQNYQDFLNKNMPEIKQHLVYVNNRQTGLDSSFQDFWSSITGNLAKEEKTKVAITNSADAVKAIIYFEELQKYPYAMADLNKDEIRSNSDLKTLVEQQKDLHAKSVEERFDYVKKNYIDTKTNIISKERIEKDEGIQCLDEILDESRIQQTMALDESYTNKDNVKGYKEYLANDLKTSNTDAFDKLEKLYAEKGNYFFEMVAGLLYYESMLNDYNIGEEEYAILQKNIVFMKKYISYKTLGKSMAELPKINFDVKKIDYNKIHNLLLTFGTTATGLAAQEITHQSIEYLTDDQLNEKYKVSTNIGQNVLYEIATSKKLGYIGKNNLNDLKMFYTEDKKDAQGIYFDGIYRCVNENNGSDNEFAQDKDLNNIDSVSKMRKYVNDAANDSFTGKMIVENKSLNKEYAKSFSDIIDKEIGYRMNAVKNKQEIIAYIKTNSAGAYIELDPDNIIKGAKSGIKNIAAFVYARDGTKLDAKSTVTGLTCELLK